jgi:hypothetical protein
VEAAPEVVTVPGPRVFKARKPVRGKKRKIDEEDNGETDYTAPKATKAAKRGTLRDFRDKQFFISQEAPIDADEHLTVGTTGLENYSMDVGGDDNDTLMKVSIMGTF